MKNIKKIVALLLVAIIAVAAFAVAVSGADIGDVVYADQGDNALNIAEIMNEYFGESIVNFYYPIGNPEIESEKSNGATQENIGASNTPAGGTYELEASGLPANIATYTGVASSTAFGLDYAKCYDGFYYNFNTGAKNSYADGLVMEFDIFIAKREDGSTMLPADFFSMGPLTTGGAKDQPHAFQMIQFKPMADGKWNINGKGSFDAGQWAHITIVYTHGNATVNGGYELYVGNDTSGRELVVTYGNAHSLGKIEPYNWRIMGKGASGSPDGVSEVVYLDNLLFYKGTKIHNPFAAKAMTNTEAYTLCMNAVCDENVANALRYTAYVNVVKNSSAISSLLNAPGASEDLKNAYAKYEAFVSVEGNVEQMLNNAKTLNTEEFNALAKIAESYNVAGVTRTLENISQREKAVAAAKEYLGSVGDMIDKTSPLYIEASNIITAVTDSCELDTQVNSFISYMTLYDNNRKSGFLTPAQKYYTKANEIYNTLPDPSVYSSGNAKTASYVAARGLYESAGTAIDQLVKEASSIRFIQIVEILCQTMADENGDLLSDAKYRRMWDSAYLLLLDNNYDPDAEGMQDAMAAFYAEGGPHEFFWAIIQQEHIDLLTEKLSGFDDPNTTYIDKAGVCKYVQFYVEQNATYIDEDNDAVFELVERADEYRKSLPAIESDYRDLLLQNTERFMATVDEIETLKDYASIKAKVEAAKEYYYAMEIVGGENGEVMRYVLKYEALEDWLKAVEMDCIIYIEVASKLDTITDENEYYVELTRGYACIEMIDDSYEGVTEAKAKFEAALDAYDATSENLNEEIYQTVDTMCSVRANTVVENIINFFRSLFN